MFDMSLDALHEEMRELRRIEERVALLNREIEERQKLKAAYSLVLEDLARRSPKPSNGERAQWSAKHEIGTLILEGHGGQPPPGTLPKVLARDYGENSRLVREAISKMTSDYNIRDIHTHLRTRGWIIEMSAIATVLNRLKRNGEITEIAAGSGRRPALFKKENQ